MRAASHLSVVRPGDRPPPMVPAEVDLSDMPKAMIPLDMVRSPWAMSCDDAEFRTGLTLWCVSFHQTPAGSLPNDDRLLARLADFGRNVAEFVAVRAKALEGWEECADGRLYRRSVAVEALSFWIKRLLKRKSSAAANSARWEKDEPADSDAFDRQIFAAGDALAQLDATNPLVLRIRAHRAKLAREAAANGAVTQAMPAPAEAEGPKTPDPSGIPIGSPKLSEAKRSQESSGKQSLPAARELDDAGQEIEPSKGDPPQEEPWVPWPEDWWERFWAVIWAREGTEAAYRALSKVRKRKLVSFTAVMAGVERYKRTKPEWKNWCNPATWINQQRWRDGDPLPADVRPPALGATEVRLVFVEQGSAAFAAWQAHARRLGKRAFPAEQQRGDKRGWSFPTEWPPAAPS